MTLELQALIKEASMELGSDACRNGKHLWESDGGRPCPSDLSNECSQAVYRCRACGEYDYGAKGGPGANDCATYCKHKPSNIEAKLKQRNT